MFQNEKNKLNFQRAIAFTFKDVPSLTEFLVFDACGLSFPWSQSGGLSLPGLNIPGLSIPGLSFPGISFPVTKLPMGFLATLGKGARLILHKKLKNDINWSL